MRVWVRPCERPTGTKQANSKQEQQNTQNALLVDIDLVCRHRRIKNNIAPLRRFEPDTSTCMIQKIKQTINGDMLNRL